MIYYSLYIYITTVYILSIGKSYVMNNRELEQEISNDRD